MSQRLHIGKTEESFYDCILIDETNTREKLLSEWFCLGAGYLIGPWKIKIDDIKLFTELQPIISEVFKYVGMQYPDDVWAIYYNERSIKHPTQEELFKWLKLPNEPVQSLREEIL